MNIGQLCRVHLADSSIVVNTIRVACQVWISPEPLAFNFFQIILGIYESFYLPTRLWVSKIDDWAIWLWLANSLRECLFWIFKKKRLDAYLANYYFAKAANKNNSAFRFGVVLLLAYTPLRDYGLNRNNIKNVIALFFLLCFCQWIQHREALTETNQHLLWFRLHLERFMRFL